MSYKLICISMDGEFVTERDEFGTIAEAWEHSNNLGSKWFFYPFHFVVSRSGLTILDAPDPFEPFRFRRVATLVRFLKGVSELPDALNLYVEDFSELVRSVFDAGDDPRKWKK